MSKRTDQSTDPAPETDSSVTGPERGVRGELAQDRVVGDANLARWDTPPGRALANGAKKVGNRLGPRATLIATLIVGMALLRPGENYL